MSSDTRVQGFDWAHLLFSFNGRTRRSHFWLGWLIWLGLTVVAGWLPLIGLVLLIALLWPGFAIVVKRLHDMGLSGWIAAVPFAVNTLGFIYMAFSIGASIMTNRAALENEDPAAIMALIGPLFFIPLVLLLLNLGFLLWIGLTDSKPGDNAHGPNPKALA